MTRFDSYIKALKENGVRVMLGANNTAFDSMLQVWNPYKEKV
jgi:hypothetical protein